MREPAISSSRRHYRPLALAATLLLAAGGEARALDLDDRKNLVEYSCDYFGEGGARYGYLKPPEIKLYQDGTVVFRRDWKYFSGKISGEQLERTRGRLRRSKWLQESAHLTRMRGDPMLHHGGLCHFLYLENGASSRLLATPVVPRGGKWRRLVEHLQDLLPATAAPFLPAKLVIQVEATRRPGGSDRQWPHAEKLDLAATAGLTEVTDPEVVRTIFLDLHRLFVQAGRSHRIHVVAVPGWFEPAKMEQSLHRLVAR